jgi:hypothetical protein
LSNVPAIFLNLRIIDKGGFAGGTAAAQAGHVGEAVFSQKIDVRVNFFCQLQISSDIFVPVAYKLRGIDVSLRG